MTFPDPPLSVRAQHRPLADRPAPLAIRAVTAVGEYRTGTRLSGWLLAWVVAATLCAMPASAKVTCSQTFTIPMFNRAVISAYWGTRVPSRSDLKHLSHFLHCGRFPWTHVVDARIWDRAKAASWLRRHPPLPPFQTSVASWYDDAGATASGWHASYGVAHLSLPFGTRVEFCYVGCAIGTVDDRGPYISGREWDLNGPLHDVIGCGDLCDVRWRVR